jgi:hypothetical protein
MGKTELILTEEQAIKFGQALQTPLAAIAKSAELSRLHGDTVASLYRVSALREFRKVMGAEELKALIIAAAGDGYEVAESDKFKIPDDVKLEGAVRAMQKGYLLSDEAGPHFTVILGKGGVSVLIKEAGHRHKLKRAGCRNVDVVAAAVKMRPRPNASGKFDMIVEGRASCVLNGEIIEVIRVADLPIILPCWESDGPDGHEAKARRRLLRDLWAKVSGDFEPIELNEIDSESMVEQVPEVLKSISQTKQTSSDKHGSAYRDCLTLMHKDPSETAIFQTIWDGIEKATTLKELDATSKDVAATLKTFSETVREAIKAFGADRRKELTEAAKP